MSFFDTIEHPRISDGTFTDKVQGAPQVTLTRNDITTDLDAEIQTRSERLRELRFGATLSSAEQGELDQLTDRLKDLHAERDERPRAAARAEFANMTPGERRDRIRLPGRALTSAEADVLSADDDVYVRRVLAGSKQRSLLSEEYAERIMADQDSIVRELYIEKNDSLATSKLDAFVSNDPSDSVREAARLALRDRRG